MQISVSDSVTADVLLKGEMPFLRSLSAHFYQYLVPAFTSIYKHYNEPNFCVGFSHSKRIYHRFGRALCQLARLTYSKWNCMLTQIQQLSVYAEAINTEVIGT